MNRFGEYTGKDGNVLFCDKGTWYVAYNIREDTTSLVIGGSDMVGVMYLVLQGDRVAEFREVAEKNYEVNKGIFGAFGECIRFASSHEDLIPERCTIGGIFSSKLKIIKTN